VIGDRWGVSEHEVVRSYPCDGFVSSPRLQAWRGVSVQAPAEVVWPWVAQVRLAPYSYDWIDNRGRRSPRELAGLPEPRAGDRFTTAGGQALGRIVPVDPGKQLTGTIMGAFMSYVLVPREDEMTRLLLKVVMQTTRWAAVGLSVGDLIMARRRLAPEQGGSAGDARRQGPAVKSRRDDVPLCGAAPRRDDAAFRSPDPDRRGPALVGGSQRAVAGSPDPAAGRAGRGSLPGRRGL